MEHQRIFNLSKWTLVPEDGYLNFSATRPRTVHLELNVQEAARLYVTEAGAEERFLCAIQPGRTKVEFSTDGAFTLCADGGPVFVYTADGQDIATRVENPEIFTTLANWKERNPHLELMMAEMRANQDRRLAEIEREAERRLKSVEERYASDRRKREEEPAATAGRGTPGEGGVGE